MNKTHGIQAVLEIQHGPSNNRRSFASNRRGMKAKWHGLFRRKVIAGKEHTGGGKCKSRIVSHNEAR